MNSVLRNMEPHTVETLLLLTSLLLIAIAKMSDENKFNSFIGLFISYRFLKLYSKEPGSTFNKFNIFLFLVQLIALTLFFEICLEYFNLNLNFKPAVLLAFLGLFILFKYYLEKIIAAIFNISDFAESFHMHKLTYRNLLAIILIPFIAFYLYSGMSKDLIIYLGIFCFISLNLMTLVLTLRNHQKLISKHLFYFILYLCALEIAPYLILIKLIF